MVDLNVNITHRTSTTALSFPLLLERAREEILKTNNDI